MGTPIPPVALTDQCTITYNNTLYVYSPEALQSLPLEPNAQWNQEPMGVSLTGATCLLGGVDGDNSKPALYVVGGSTNSTSVQYSGLQRYSIQDKTWHSITPQVTVTENRQRHGAAYMLDTSTILVYGGSQNGDSDPSTQTFLIATYPPYDVMSFQSEAPPVVDPIMLPWDDGHVGMVGGGSTNVGVWRFGVDEGWTDVGVTLPNPLPGPTVAQCALLTLDDQSKILETFDLSQSPNVVTSNVLLQPGGSPAPFGETVGGSTTTTAPASSTSLASSRSRKRKRDVVLSNFPVYNSTFAPTTTRSGFSLSQGSNGLIVIAGGSSSGQVAIFNQTANGWLNASQLLNPQGKSQTVIAGPSSTTSSTATPTSSPTAGTSPVHPSKSHPLTLLGVVLGAICGFAAILIILLLLLRYLKRSRNLKMQRQRDGYPGEKRRAHGRSDTEDIPLSRNGQPMGKSPVSSTIYQGDDPTLSAGRADFKNSHGRTLSSASNKLKLDPIQSSHISFGPAMFSKPKEKSPLTISRPIMQDPASEILARPKTDNSQANTEPSQSSGTIDLAKTIGASHRKTDEGWSTYFQGNNVVNLTGDRPSFMSNNSRPGSSSSRNSKRGSYWPDPGLAAAAAPVAAAINAPFKPTPSNLRDSSGHMLSAISVPMGSPKLEHSASYRNDTGLVVSDGVHGKISSASSTSDDNDDYEPVEYGRAGEAYSSGIPEGGAYSSGIPESVHELPAWTPVGNTWSGPVQRQFRSRGSSTSDFTSSVLNPPYAAAVSNEANIHGFPMPNPTIRKVGLQSADQPKALPQIQHPTAAHFAATIPNQPVVLPPTRPSRPEENRDYFGLNFGRTHENTNTDVSWLNLGTPQGSNTPHETPGSITTHETPGAPR
jgi:hypothetical protein